MYKRIWHALEIEWIKWILRNGYKQQLEVAEVLIMTPIARISFKNAKPRPISLLQQHGLWNREENKLI